MTYSCDDSYAARLEAEFTSGREEGKEQHKQRLDLLIDRLNEQVLKNEMLRHDNESLRRERDGLVEKVQTVWFWKTVFKRDGSIGFVHPTNGKR